MRVSARRASGLAAPRLHPQPADLSSAVCAGTAGPERLAEIILGLLAVREVEGWDDELADLLHSIQAAVNRRATPLA